MATSVSWRNFQKIAESDPYVAKVEKIKVETIIDYACLLPESTQLSEHQVK